LIPDALERSFSVWYVRTIDMMASRPQAMQRTSMMRQKRKTSASQRKEKSTPSERKIHSNRMLSARITGEDMSARSELGSCA
jgi:hypothetical protein